jgi:trehalose-6-phosphate synthase
MPHVKPDSRLRPLVVVSNREPYVHSYSNNGPIVATATTGGLAVALDSLMRDRGGTWIAHGAGEADRAVVDRNSRVTVPNDAPAYTLRRVWLSPDEERRYYHGFANEGLWPMCHTVDVRPLFRSEDWGEYSRVNARFAEAIAAELWDPAVPVFIHDYHLALTAAALRTRHPRARTAFMIGLLANDLLAFQLERDRRNFLLCVRDELPSAIVESGQVMLNGRVTEVIAAPIGVDVARIHQTTLDPQLPAETARLRKELALDDPRVSVIGVGVDRLDYTKGIPERLDAIERLLWLRPDLRDRLAFVQVGVPSRSKISTYAEIERRVDARVAEINTLYGEGPERGPIRLRKSALTLRPLVALYRLADFCIVSSLHDGMNLVAKEFVASRDDGNGVLVLSEMTGAAQELTEALLINPYHVDGFALAIEHAIAMPAAERAYRMRALHRVVAARDVSQWASGILDRLGKAQPVFREVRSRAQRSTGRLRVSAGADRVRSNVS